MADSIALSASIRSNLLLLQQTTTQLDKTQLRLATGNKVNSALDGPANFFAAKGLSQRAGDLDGLKDNIGQAISTVKGADEGISSIETFIEQARGLTTQALGSLGNDANSVALRNSLANQYDNLLRQIDSAARDSGYQGKNLLVGSGLQLSATASSKTTVNAIAGISGATVTNVVSADTYDVSITGDGAITGSANDIANAEKLRGISNLEITGFASTSNFNFDSVSIKLSGGTGKAKTFTISEGNQTFTTTFTVAQWEEAEAQGTVLRLSNSFNSGTRISFDVNFDDIEDVPDTAGVGTSIIEKNVNLQVIATNQNGETVTRDGLNLLGNGKVANGENAFAFDSGTARVKVDERQILLASAYTQAASASYGTGAGAITNVTATGVSVDETISVVATAASFNYSTNKFETFSVSVAGSGDNDVTAVTGISAGSGAVSVAGVGRNSTATYQLTFNTNELTFIGNASAATNAEINTTLQKSSGNVSVVAVGSAQSGFLNNAVTTLTFSVSGTSAALTIAISDGRGGTATISTSGAATGASFSLAGGVNDGANLALSFTASDFGTSATGGPSGVSTLKVRGEYEATREAKFDVRGSNTGDSATIETEQLVDGTDANNLTVQLNETNTSTVTVVSQNVQTDGQGLQLDFAQNGWNDRADIENAIRQLDAAKLKLRAASSSLGTNLNIIQTRETFTAEFSNVLKEGAGKLTLADQNEEGANILTLQTRQQLGTISLSLANQAQQAILRLF